VSHCLLFFLRVWCSCLFFFESDIVIELINNKYSKISPESLSTNFRNLVKTWTVSTPWSRKPLKKFQKTSFVIELHVCQR
jgi:hypothetical protein